MKSKSTPDSMLRIEIGAKGIGLSLVKRIIEIHNKLIWVNTEKNNGATFFFTLPTPQLTKE